MSRLREWIVNWENPFADGNYDIRTIHNIYKGALNREGTLTDATFAHTYTRPFRRRRRFRQNLDTLSPQARFIRERYLERERRKRWFEIQGIDPDEFPESYFD